MLAEFKQHILSSFPELLSKRVGVAASAGLDSTVLLHLLRELKIDTTIVHFNFQLRSDESDGDESFLRELASNYNVAIEVCREDTLSYATLKKMSIQEAARELRYTFFNKLIDDHTVDYVVTAHHLDDQLETFLINLGRGTGLKGLLGIPPWRHNIARPLLPYSREQILQYANYHNLKWREDSSNNSLHYQRNQLRIKAIPILLESLPHLTKTFQATLNNLRQVYELSEVEVLRFRESVTRKIPQGFEIDLNKVQDTVNTATLLYELLKPYGFNTSDIKQILTASTGRSIHSRTHTLYKDRQKLLISKKTAAQVSDISINSTGIYHLGNTKLKVVIIETMDALDHIARTKSAKRCYVDFDKVGFPFLLRAPRRGDRINPIGFVGSQLISNILVNNKLSMVDKASALVLCSNTTILWLLGYRASREFLITSTTTRILQFEVLENE
ncbi:MAG: tRNA lysidine(34) synthetase TilS [Nonlabens sp.]